MKDMVKRREILLTEKRVASGLLRVDGVIAILCDNIRKSCFPDIVKSYLSSNQNNYGRPPAGILNFLSHTSVLNYFKYFVVQGGYKMSSRQL